MKTIVEPVKLPDGSGFFVAEIKTDCPRYQCNWCNYHFDDAEHLGHQCPDEHLHK